jgi:predicted nucleic acid-binding protein
LIDTNVVSEVRKGARCNANVARWMTGVDQKSLYVSVLVLGEIRQAILRLGNRDLVLSQSLERWLAAFDTVFSDRIVPIDRAVADMWGRINAIRTVPAIDGLMAATALARGMTFVTRDTADVEDLGVTLLNPFLT